MFLPGTHIHGVIGRSHPQADDISAVVLDRSRWAPRRCRRSCASACPARPRPSRGAAPTCRVRSPWLATLVSRLDWNQPRNWSPPSIYISAGKFSSGTLLQNGSMGGTGIEPDIHDVGILRPLGSAALLADFACGMICSASVLIPGVGAFLAEQLADSLDGGIGDVVSAALLAVEGRGWARPRCAGG